MFPRFPCRPSFPPPVDDFASSFRLPLTSLFKFGFLFFYPLFRRLAVFWKINCPTQRTSLRLSPHSNCRRTRKCRPPLSGKFFPFSPLNCGSPLAASSLGCFPPGPHLTSPVNSPLMASAGFLPINPYYDLFSLSYYGP